MAKKFKFEPLQNGDSVQGTTGKVADTVAGSSRSGMTGEDYLKKVKVAAQLPEALHEHLMSHCFFDDERPTQEMVIIRALEQYLFDKPNKPLPDHIKNRPRAGRKPKNS